MRKFFQNPIVQIAFFTIVFLGIGFFYPWITQSILGGKAADQSLMDESINLMATILSAVLGFILVYLLWPHIQRIMDERRSLSILNGRLLELQRKAQKSLELIKVEFSECDVDAVHERDEEIIRTIKTMGAEFDKISSMIIETSFLVRSEFRSMIMAIISNKIEPEIVYLHGLREVRGECSKIQSSLDSIVSATKSAIDLLPNGKG